MNGEQALQNDRSGAVGHAPNVGIEPSAALRFDLARARGLRGLATHLGPEESLPPDLVEHALDALPDEGDRLVRALIGRAGVSQSDPLAKKLPFCGRRETLEVIYNAVRDAVAQRHLHVVEIAGERGLGKTRVLAEALAIIDPESRGIDVLPIAARPGDGPQALLAQLVRRRFGILPRDSDQTSYDRIIEALEPLFDERTLVGNARLIGHLAGLRAMGPGADALPADLETFRRHALKAFVAVFRLDLAKAPRILVLQRPDHLHERTLETLMNLVGELANEPLVLAVLSEGRSHFTTLAEALPAERATFVRVEVEALAERDVERLVSSLFAESDVEPELAKALVDHARGNPRLVLENARLLVQRGALVATEAGLVRGSQAVPATELLARDLDEASRLRVGALSAIERGLLQAAAIFGRAFEAEGALAVGTSIEPDLVDGLAFAYPLDDATGNDAMTGLASAHLALQRLIGAGVLRPVDLAVSPSAAVAELAVSPSAAVAGLAVSPSAAAAAPSVAVARLASESASLAAGAAGWRFAHPSDRARLLSELGGETRELMHALAAQWLEARPLAGHDPGLFYEAVAAHWLRARRKTESARALVRAGESARDGLALPRAKALLRTALEALGLHSAARGLDRAPLLLSTALTYADLALKTGDFHDAHALCAGALEAARALEPRPPLELAPVARAWLLFGRAHRGLGAYGLAKASLARAADLSRRAADARGSGDALTELARVHWLEGGEGGYAEALRLLEEALDVRRGLGSARAIAETLGLIANIRIQRGDFDGARAPLEEASALAREAFDLAGEARALMALGAIAYFGNDFERALEVWKDGLRAAEIAGERELVGAFLNNIGETRLSRGELDHAAAALLEAREITTETGDLRTLTDVLKNLSALYAQRGDLLRAQAIADEAFALATAMNARPSLGPALRGRAEVRSLRAIAEGSAELARQAEADFVAAIAIFTDLGDAAELARTQTALANHQRLNPPAA